MKEGMTLQQFARSIGIDMEDAPKIKKQKHKKNQTTTKQNKADTSLVEVIKQKLNISK